MAGDHPELDISRSLLAGKEINYIDIQSEGEAFHIVDRDIPLASLYRADIGSMKPGEFGHAFLRHCSLLPSRPKAVGEAQPR